MDNARELSSRLQDLLRREHSALADFLLALADFDRRRLWVELGYSSLFHYLHRRLGMSKGAAHYRKTAAELVQKVPEVVEPLRDGRLCMTSIIELAKVLTPENREEVLPRFFNCSRQEAKAVSAELCPAEVVPARTVVTSFPSQVPAPPLLLSPVNGVQPVEPEYSAAGTPPAASPVAVAVAVTAQAPRSIAEPLTADLRRLHVSVSKRFMEKLEAAKDALSHSRPGADAETILEAGLDLVLERVARRKGLVKRPRTVVAPVAPAGDEVSGDPRYVPAAVQREVWVRDEGRCQWALEGGGICGSTHLVELDHTVPVGRGGKPTVDGVRVLCRFHNDLAAREVYGDAWMDRFTGGGRGARGRSGKVLASPPATSPP